MKLFVQIYMQGEPRRSRRVLGPILAGNLRNTDPKMSSQTACKYPGNFTITDSKIGLGGLGNLKIFEFSGQSYGCWTWGQKLHDRPLTISAPLLNRCLGFLCFLLWFVFDPGGPPGVPRGPREGPQIALGTGGLPKAPGPLRARFEKPKKPYFLQGPTERSSLLPA